MIGPCVTVMVVSPLPHVRRVDRSGPVLRYGVVVGDAGCPCSAQSVATARAVASALFCAERASDDVATDVDGECRADEHERHGEDQEDRGDTAVVTI